MSHTHDLTMLIGECVGAARNVRITAGDTSEKLQFVVK